MRNNTSRITRISILVIACFCSFTVSAQDPKEDPLKVLFVGNSFLHFYNTPQVIAAMMETGDSPMIARKSTVGGSNLEHHWKGKKGLETMKLLASEDWDYVVFNNHSRSAFETPESFMTYGKKFAAKVKEIGAKPVFMITWAYESNPLMQGEITAGYERLAQETGADLVPAGPLFEMARALRPNLKLFHDDKHQSAIGTYLISLAFYQYFKNESVMDVTTSPKISDINGESVQLIFIEKKEADFLKQLVEDYE